MDGPGAENTENERREPMAEITRKTAFHLDAPTSRACLWLSDIEKLRRLAELEPDIYITCRMPLRATNWFSNVCSRCSGTSIF